MAGRECYHCKQWVEEGEAHDCWTTTEAALTQDLSEDLRDAWERLRETAAVVWRPADLRLAQVDHVLAQVLLLLRASEEELPRGLRVPRPDGECPSGATRRPRVEVQGRAHHPDQAPGRVEAPVTDWLRRRTTCRVGGRQGQDHPAPSKPKAGPAKKKAQSLRKKAKAPARKVKRR